VSALGAVLINHERSHALPGILDKMNGPIQDICKILENDIGKVGKPGLASALHRDYDDQIAAQQQSDAALASTAKALTSLAAAHAALMATKGQKDSPAFKMELSQLVTNVQTFNSFYLSLNKK
jgi:hypothetical protein